MEQIYSGRAPHSLRLDNLNLEHDESSYMRDYPLVRKLRNVKFLFFEPGGCVSDTLSEVFLHQRLLSMTVTSIMIDA